MTIDDVISILHPLVFIGFMITFGFRSFTRSKNVDVMCSDGKRRVFWLRSPADKVTVALNHYLFWYTMYIMGIVVAASCAYLHKTPSEELTYVDIHSRIIDIMISVAVVIHAAGHYMIASKLVGVVRLQKDEKLPDETVIDGMILANSLCVIGVTLAILSFLGDILL